MAKSNSVWGIDIGQCALKALRCTKNGDRVVVDAFDYIEYPKILSQPDEADPKQLVREALEQFLSRNEVKGHKVAISVPGQAGLARFFKPPPVDAKKIPDIVKYEARQQIPFALEDVIWDYQLMGGNEVDGFAIDAEVGLFAMKREQVFRALEPFTRAGIELDIVQLSPLSIFNFISYDLLGNREATFDPDNPPPSLVVLALGTETTDLVVTNGFRVWQRSIPLGGNHFTKQLTKELKLTFAKAEHLKRNARTADDPKKVFQAMRPVFNDLVTEVQRSVSYFQNIDRKAKIQGVVILGNTVKLPGLQPYLAKNLGYDIVNFDQFHRLDETSVSSSPAYKENQLAFGVCYGLCLQGLGASKLNTNLIPREIVLERLIRAKKPWVVASVASLLLACSFNFFFNYSVWFQVHEDRSVGGVSWKEAEQAVSQVKSVSDDFVRKDKETLATKQLVERIGDEVVGNADRRILWLELMTALNQALPRTPGVAPGQVPDPKVLPYDQRMDLHILSVETQHYEDMSTWFTDLVKTRYAEGTRVLRGDPDPATSADPNAAAGTQPVTGVQAGAQPGAAPALEPPKGEGWVIQLEGYHYHNSDPATSGHRHVIDTIIRNLEDGEVALPNPKAGGEPVVFKMKELGILYPVLVTQNKIEPARLPNPNYSGTRPGQAGGGNFGVPPTDFDGGEEPDGGLGDFDGGGFPPGGGFGGGATFGPPSGFGAAGGAGGGYTPGGGGTITGEQPDANGELPSIPVKKYSFVVQFCWQPKPLTKRLQEQEEARKKAQEEAERQQQQQQQQQPDSVAARTP